MTEALAGDGGKSQTQGRHVARRPDCSSSSVSTISLVSCPRGCSVEPASVSCLALGVWLAFQGGPQQEAGGGRDGVRERLNTYSPSPASTLPESTVLSEWPPLSLHSDTPSEAMAVARCAACQSNSVPLAPGNTIGRRDLTAQSHLRSSGK